MLREADDAEKKKQELRQQYLELFAEYKEYEEARQRLRALADEYKSLEAEVARPEDEIAEREKLLKDILGKAGLDLEGLEEASKRVIDYREYIASVRSEAARLPQAGQA